MPPSYTISGTLPLVYELQAQLWS